MPNLHSHYEHTYYEWTSICQYEYGQVFVDKNVEDWIGMCVMYNERQCIVMSILNVAHIIGDIL